MDPIQLFTPGGEPAVTRHGDGVYLCGKCGSVRIREGTARGCCACLNCGLEPPETHRVYCRACIEKIDAEDRRKRAEKEADRLDRAEKVDAWDGPVFADRGPRDGFFDDLGALVEYLEEEAVPVDEWPGFAHLAAGKPRRVDLGRIIENAYDDMCEDLEVDDLKGMAELQAAVDAFNEANKGVVVYNPDYRRAVAVPRP